jgi:hypothetical protein
MLDGATTLAEVIAGIQRYGLPVVILQNAVNFLGTGTTPETRPRRLLMQPVSAHARAKPRYVPDVSPLHPTTCEHVEMFRGACSDSDTFHYMVYDVAYQHLAYLGPKPTYREYAFIAGEARIYLCGPPVNNMYTGLMVNNPRSKVREHPLSRIGRRAAFQEAVGDILKVYYDMETVLDSSDMGICTQIPFKIGCFAEIPDCVDIDNVEATGERLDELLAQVEIFSGFYCVTNFLKYLLTLHALWPSKSVVLIGFNSSKYDNVLLLRHMMNSDAAFPTTTVEMQGPHVSRVAVFHKMFCFDMARFVRGSLEDCCKDFGVVRLCKKSKPDFLRWNRLFATHSSEGFMDALEDSATSIDEYLKYDVLSLAALHHKFSAVWSNFECVKAVSTSAEDFVDGKHMGLKDLCCYPSLSAATYELCRLTWLKKNPLGKKEKFVLPQLEPAHYDMVRTHMVGGMCSTFDHDAGETLDEPMMSLDVASMYGFCMYFLKGAYFPCGKITSRIMDHTFATTVYTALTNYISQDPFQGKPELMGFFWVSIDQTSILSAGRSPLEPKKKEEGGNDWSWNGDALIQERIFINFYRIAELLRYGCEATLILDVECILFSEMVRGIDLFSVLDEAFQIKDAQDKLKATKDPAYNGSLRTVAKDMPNTLSGKFAERIRDTITASLSREEIVDIESSPDRSEPHSMSIICDDKPRNRKANISITDPAANAYYICSYRIPREEALRTAKPVYLTAVIYTFSHMYLRYAMLNGMGHIASRYTDTDCLKFARRDFARIAESVAQPIPVWPDIIAKYPVYDNHPIYSPGSKIIGSLEDELRAFFTGLDDCVTVLCVIAGPKMYGMFAIHPADQYLLPTAEKEERRSRAVSKLKGVTSKAVWIDNEPQFAELQNLMRGVPNNVHGLRMTPTDTNFSLYKWVDNKDLLEAHQWTRTAEVQHALFERLSQHICCYFVQQIFQRDIHAANRGCTTEQVEKFQDFGRVRSPIIIKRIEV